VTGSPDDLLGKIELAVVRPRSTFCRMLEKLTTFNCGRGLHRVYVVDESNHPLSIVTLTDVLRTIVRYDEMPITRRLSLERGKEGEVKN
jgi:CBS domain-containing protein